jgi:hypothetical protein
MKLCLQAVDSLMEQVTRVQRLLHVGRDTVGEVNRRHFLDEPANASS